METHDQLLSDLREGIEPGPVLNLVRSIAEALRHDPTKLALADDVPASRQYQPSYVRRFHRSAEVFRTEDVDFETLPPLLVDSGYLKDGSVDYELCILKTSPQCFVVPKVADMVTDAERPQRLWLRGNIERI